MIPSEARQGKEERKDSHKYSYGFRYWYGGFFFVFLLPSQRSLYRFFHTYFFLSLSHTHITLHPIIFCMMMQQDGHDKFYVIATHLKIF